MSFAALALTRLYTLAKRSVLTRGKEHGNAVTRENWHHSGISAHKEFCKEPIDWDSPKVINTKTNKNKRKLNFDLKVCEALEIKRRNCGPGQGLNEKPMLRLRCGIRSSITWTVDKRREGGTNPSWVNSVVCLFLLSSHCPIVPYCNFLLKYALSPFYSHSPLRMVMIR